MNKMAVFCDDLAAMVRKGESVSGLIEALDDADLKSLMQEMKRRVELEVAREYDNDTARRPGARLRQKLLSTPDGVAALEDARRELDAARKRVAASGGPSLRELVEAFSAWEGPEVSGKMVRV